MSQHFPVLLVAVPLILAPIAALTRSGRAAWVVALGACWWAFAMAIAAAAARTAEGATLWVYGAATEGIRTAASSFPAGLFADVAVARVVA